VFNFLENLIFHPVDRIDWEIIVRSFEESAGGVDVPVA